MYQKINSITAIKSVTLSLLLLLIAYSSRCRKTYEPLQPGLITKAEAHFNGSNGQQKTIQFLFSVPVNYENKKAYPFVVALHGDGSNAAAFHDLWKPVTDSLGMVLLTPQGEHTIVEGLGFGWGNNAERSVLICIDIVKDLAHIDSEHVFVAGFSKGGSLAYALGLKYSQLFNGIAVISGRFDEKIIPKQHFQINKMSAYISHGELEEDIAVNAKCAIQKMEALGMMVEYKVYEGIGHTLPEPKSAELIKILKYLLFST